MVIRVANHSSYPGDDESAWSVAVRDQEDAGIDVATDGRQPWGEPLSHFLGSLRGVRWGSMQRWLDGETPFCQPVIEAKLRPGPARSDDDYRRTRRATARCELKPVLLGPYTVACMSAIATTAYRDVRALATDLALFLASEVRALAEAGARIVQIDEPLVLRHPEDIRWLREILEPLHDAAAGSAAISLATYLGDAEPLYAQLNSLPVDVVAVDCTAGPAIAETIASVGSGKPLALGIVDGRAPGTEDAAATARFLERLLRRYAHDVVHIQPSCGLARLTREQALAKLETLRRARDLVAGTAPANRSR